MTLSIHSEKWKSRKKGKIHNGGGGGGGGPPGPSPGSATEYDAKVLPKRFPLNSLANGIWSMNSKYIYI